jgi:voltage-gated potassium channel Kch
VTIAASTYMITWSHQLYAFCEPWLGMFERKGTPREANEAGAHPDLSEQIILFGLGRFGTAIGLRLKDRGVKVLGLDFNPLAVRRWQDLGLEAQFSDATDPEFVRDLPLHHAAWIVLTVPRQAMGLSHEDARSTLLQLLRTAGFGGKIAGE